MTRQNGIRSPPGCTRHVFFLMWLFCPIFVCFCNVVMHHFQWQCAAWREIFENHPMLWHQKRKTPTTNLCVAWCWSSKVAITIKTLTINLWGRHGIGKMGGCCCPVIWCLKKKNDNNQSTGAALGSGAWLHTKLKKEIKNCPGLLLWPQIATWISMLLSWILFLQCGHVYAWFFACHIVLLFLAMGKPKYNNQPVCGWHWGWFGLIIYLFIYLYLHFAIPLFTFKHCFKIFLGNWPLTASLMWRLKGKMITINQLGLP